MTIIYAIPEIFRNKNYKRKKLFHFSAILAASDYVSQGKGFTLYLKKNVWFIPTCLTVA